ncbi:NADPH-dependent 7-cyano-7-deazaguanine reductase QueF [Oxalobacteraceae bacterium CAVE-383]|nr:NADPH-dependent 7-cyano-7-deazaguanine reductase QueF [Oxalobacteraceae bacterium CAVE-383]
MEIQGREFELGKKSEYETCYNPQKLFPIPRQEKRREIGISGALPFYGADIWNHYEVSWLTAKGKPQVAIAEIIYGCESPCIIESKSMKLYFNTFNNTRFADTETVRKTLEQDISANVGIQAQVILTLLDDGRNAALQGLDGQCIDALDINIDAFELDRNLLKISDQNVEEILYSNLLKSNCLVTNQPDWGSVQISYKGRKIDREGLLRYIVSFRNHNEFHEQCIERIFMDIQTCCQPESLTVYGRYTRRGGLDINPIRSTQKIQPTNNRNQRQ